MSKKESKDKSEEVKNQEELDQEVQDAQEEGAAEPEIELSDLEKKEIELKEANEKFLRLYSEFDNFRRRTAKEKLDITMSAGSEIIKELLPVLDDFDRAATNNEQSKDIDTIKEGFNLIHNKLNHILTSKGLKKLASQNEVFDVDKHEALTQIPAPSKDLKGKVVDVIEPGYTLNDKVIRFAKVVVGN